MHVVKSTRGGNFSQERGRKINRKGKGKGKGGEREGEKGWFLLDIRGLHITRDWPPSL